MTRKAVQYLSHLIDHLKKKVYPKISEVGSEIGAWYDQVAAAQETIYDVPTGKRFSLEWLVIYNEDAGPIDYVFYDSTDTSIPIMELRVAGTTVVTIKDLKGIVFDTIVEVTPSAFVTGHQFNIGGKLVDQ